MSTKKSTVASSVGTRSNLNMNSNNNGGDAVSLNSGQGGNANHGGGGGSVSGLVPTSASMPEVTAEAIGVRLVLRHTFGYGYSMGDEILSYQSSSREKDVSESIVFRVGKQICITEKDGSSPQKFLSNKSPSVKRILHISISKNHRYISACESLNKSTSASDAGSTAQVSIFSLATMSKQKTISRVYSSGAEFIQAVFLSDTKYLVTLLDGLEPQIIVWQWEKDKMFKNLVLPSKASRILPSPSHNLVTVSGTGFFRTAYIGTDGVMKLSTLFNSSQKENDNFLTHAWIPHQELNSYQVVVLGSPQDESVNGSHGGSVHSDGNSSSKKQFVHLFEGSDAPFGSSGPPVALELKSSIPMRLEQGIVLTAVATYTKGFVLFGTQGFVSYFERSEDKREPFVEVRRLLLGGIRVDKTAFGAGRHDELMPGSSVLGDHPSALSDKEGFEVVASATVMPSEEEIVMVCRSNRILSLPLTTIEQMGTSSASLTDHSTGSKGSNVLDAASIAPSSSPLTNVFFGGGHVDKIIGLDIAGQRPVAATISMDSSFRLWDFESLRCELVHEFRSDDAPLALSIHYTGFQVLISFKDRVKLFNILQNKLKQFRELPLKNCKEIRFSNGGHLWAAASTLTVLVYDSKDFQQLYTFQGHMMSVKKLLWGPSDAMLFSAGMDGCVYGWLIGTEARVDVLTSSSRTAPVLSLGVQGQTPGILGLALDKRNGRVPEDWMENGPFATSLVGPNSLVIGLGDSTLKLSEYNALLDTKSANLSTKPEHLKSATFKLDGKVSVTAVCIADDRNNLYLGMSDGTLRVYQWPVLAENPPFMEIVAHNSAIVDLREAPNGAAIISAAEDCTVFVHTALKGDMLAFGGSHHAASMFMGGADNPMNSDILLVAKEDIEENLNEIQELNKRLRESEAKSEFSRRNLDLQHAEEVRKLVDAHQTALNTERDKCESIQTLMNQKISSLNEQLRMSADEHVKTASEIENRYEHKLADQFDRYDRLAEDMEALKQRCEGLLAAERADYERQLNDLRSDARQREKRMKAENKRMRDERSADENSFKEILDQQEDEYEGELKQLIAAAEAELKCERERIMKLQSALETKKTKMAQLIKKLKEVENGFNKGLQNLQHEKKEKQRLIETVNHLKKNLAEREDALAEKEKTILDLRSNTRTLENFRIVLDHRLQQLSAERGPISEHIVGLENHIRDMYEELVAEFDVKKLTSAEIENKDRKIATITQEVAILRADARAKETIISAFKRDLESLLVCYSPKELEESVRRMYRRYIKGADNAETSDPLKSTHNRGTKTSSLATKLINNEDISDDDSVGAGGGANRTGKAGSSSNNAGNEKRKRQKDVVKEIDQELLESAQEANRQRAFINRAATDLKHRLDLSQTEAMRLSQRRLHENSRLVYECNELRLELKEQTRKYRLAVEERDRLAVALANNMPGTMIASLASQGLGSREDQGRANDEDSMKMRNIDITAYDNVSMHSSVTSIDPRRKGRASDSSIVEKIYDDPAWLGNKQKLTKVPGVFKENSKVIYQMPSTGSGQIPLSLSASALPISDQQGKSGNVSHSVSQPNLLVHSKSRAVSPVQTKLPDVHGKSAGKSQSASPTGAMIPDVDITSSSQQANSNAATLRARLNAAVGAKLSNKNVELKAKRAIGEAESLAERLDASEVERQRLQAEITRLRFQLSKAGISSGQVLNGGIGSAAHMSRRSGEAPNGALLPGTIPFTDPADPQGLLTHADKTGSPSRGDLKRMNVSSAKGNARPIQVYAQIRGASGPSRSADQEGVRARVIVESAGIGEADDFDSVKDGSNRSKSSSNRGNNDVQPRAGRVDQDEFDENDPENPGMTDDAISQVSSLGN